MFEILLFIAITLIALSQILPNSDEKNPASKS